MRKFYLTLLTALLLTSVTFGQRKVSNQIPVKPSPSLSAILNPPGTAGACDTLNYPIPTTWTLTYYVTGTNGKDGFVAGTNTYKDKQKGNFFDASTTTYNYLSGVGLYFAKANSNKSADLTKNVMVKVYDDAGAGGSPGSQIGTTVNIPLSQIKTDVGNNALTQVMFAAPIALPASKKFYVTIDVSNFSWTLSTKDSISLVTTKDGDVVPGQGWEQWSDDSWNDMNSAWGGLNIALIILPYLNTDATGSCSALPVHFLSFTSQRNNNDVNLNWTIADEIGMKGYEVERSSNNGSYASVAYVPALNNNKNQGYSVTDKNAFASSATLQYRIKQIDGDGSVKYSKVLQVKSGSAINDVVFANPFNGALKVQLNLASSQTVSAKVYDLQGRLTAMEKPSTYSGASNTIVLNSTANLKTGTYILKLNVGTEERTFKIVKQ